MTYSKRERMNEKKYKVLYNENVVAENMDIHTAMILGKALLEEHPADSRAVVSFVEMDRTTATISEEKRFPFGIDS